MTIARLYRSRPTCSSLDNPTYLPSLATSASSLQIKNSGGEKWRCALTPELPGHIFCGWSVSQPTPAWPVYKKVPHTCWSRSSTLQSCRMVLISRVHLLDLLGLVLPIPVSLALPPSPELAGSVELLDREAVLSGGRVGGCVFLLVVAISLVPELTLQRGRHRPGLSSPRTALTKRRTPHTQPI